MRMETAPYNNTDLNGCHIPMLIAKTIAKYNIRVLLHHQRSICIHQP
jgi:hypothetical protein